MSHTHVSYRLNYCDVATERIGRKVGMIYVGLTAEAQPIHWKIVDVGAQDRYLKVMLFMPTYLGYTHPPC